MRSPTNNPPRLLFPAAKVPSVSARSVIVCFADIRGFTTFVKETNVQAQGYIDQLLLHLYSAVNTAFLEVTKDLSSNSGFESKILGSAWPTLRKTLGDGFMLVWEYPQHCPQEVSDGFGLFILDFIQVFQTSFYTKKAALSLKIPQMEALIKPLHIGLGLAGGYAWKLGGFGSEGVDYAGTPVTAAAMLQELADPCGLVADISILPNILLERWSMDNEGTIGSAEPKGHKGIFIWQVTDRTTIARRQPRNAATYQGAISSMKRPGNGSKMGNLTYSPHDISSIFDVREKFEVDFVGHLTEKIKNHELTNEDLKKISPQLAGKRFHQGIAHLSAAPDENKGRERMEFVDWAYDKTFKVHQHVHQTPAQIEEDHTIIFNAIDSGDAAHAKLLMEQHLRKNRDVGMEGLWQDILKQKQTKK